MRDCNAWVRQSLLLLMAVVGVLLSLGMGHAVACPHAMSNASAADSAFLQGNAFGAAIGTDDLSAVGLGDRASSDVTTTNAGHYSECPNDDCAFVCCRHTIATAVAALSHARDSLIVRATSAEPKLVPRLAIGVAPGVQANRWRDYAAVSRGHADVLRITGRMRI